MSDSSVATRARATLALMAQGAVLYRETELETRCYLSHRGRLRRDIFVLLRERGLIAQTGRTETGLETWGLSEMGRRQCDAKI